MIYFLTGDITLNMRYDEVLKSLRDKNVGIVEKIYNVDDKGEEKFFEAISNNSIFSSKELIILKGMENIKKLDKFLEILGNYDLSQKEIIFLYRENLDDYDRAINRPTKKIMDLIEQKCKVILCRKELEKKSLHFYVEKELKISEYDAEKFCSLIGEDYERIKTEVEKVKIYLKDENFSFEKIMKIISLNKEGNLKVLIEKFIYEKKKNELIEFLQREKEYMRFLYLLNEELLIFYKLKLLEERRNIEAGISYKNFKENIYEGIKKYFRRERGDYIKEYPIFLKFKYLGLNTKEFYENKLKEILYLESNIKSGILPDDIGVEKFIGSF